MDAVIFDLDGTLWDAMEPIYEAWGTILRESRLPHVDFTMDFLQGCMGKTPEQIAALAFPGAEYDARMTEMQRLYDYENELLTKKGGRLYPGVEQTLRTLGEKHALMIVSNSQDGYIPAFLQWTGLDCFLDFEMAGRTGLDKGSNIRLVMERNGIDRAVYVGDTQGDADGAEKAGVPFVYAAYGFGAVARFDGKIDAFAELPAVLKKFF